MGRLSKLLPGRRPSALVGIDVSTRRVKLLELARRGDSHHVVAYASEPLPEGAVQEFQIENAETVSRAVASALGKAGTRNRSAAIAVTGPAVISKTILLPAAMDDLEMEQQIQFDAEHYVSHPIGDVHIDFQVLEPDPKDPSFNRVLLVACRRETIEMRIAALQMAGLRVRLVDVEDYALQNACALLGPDPHRRATDGVFAVFDVGARDTRVTVQHGARSRYTRSIGFGALSFANGLIERHGLSDIDQLHAQLRVGELAAEDIATDLDAFADELAGHIDRTLNFYLSAATEDDEVIDRIVVTGGAARYPGLGTALDARLSRPTILGNPVAGMSASAIARRNHLESDGPSLMVAAGLALRGAT